MLILVLFTTLGGMLFGKHADDRFSLYFLESQGRLLESKGGLRDRLAVEMHERQLICCRLTHGPATDSSHLHRGCLQDKQHKTDSALQNHKVHKVECSVAAK